MWPKRRFLSVLAGLSLLGIPAGAMAAVHFDVPSHQVMSMSQGPSQHSSVVLAYEGNPYEWRQQHHHYPSDPNGYSWGTRYRYEYAPGWFATPPPGWAVDRRRTYLEERRRVAINMQQQMLARGDINAARRLGAVIGQLDNQLHYR
jgi:hypothetical protein